MPNNRNSRFAVIGTGRYGSQIALKLAEKGAEVYAIDSEKDKVDHLDEFVYTAVTLDSTDKRALESQNLHEVDAAVIAIGENFEATIITAMNLMDLNVKRVIARASNNEQRLILQKIGVQEILFPEEIVGSLVTEQLINPDILSAWEISEEFEIVEIIAPKGILGDEIGSLNLKENFKISCVTIKQEFEKEINGKLKLIKTTKGILRPDTVVEENDHLVLFGRPKDIEDFIEIKR